MKNNALILSLALLALAPNTCAAQAEATCANQTGQLGWIRHPWAGKRVGYLGDSITDPRNNSKDVKKKFWGFLEDWLGIRPFVYAKSGRQWDDIPRQAELLRQEHGDSIDAIIVLIGTNDFNAGVPVGEWYVESEDTITAAVHGPRQLYRRMRRNPAMTDDTFKGRINKGVRRLKQLFPDKQLVLLTPLHRGYAAFSATSVQPGEDFQNICGQYFSEYVAAVKEAANVWGVPVIDLNSVSGMNPTVDEQTIYYRRPDTDRLHPSTDGQERMARTLAYQLLTLP